jgi:3-isopropylmalate/(R)-2-methylmalate dehydratase small subunit
MEPITNITSKTVVLPLDDVDTDQIIPARFLVSTGRDNLAEAAFADWRYDAEGQPKQDFVLNQAETKGASILVTGNNFGCGSSREHAPWALLDYGFRAVISTDFADIFRNNALKNGLVPVIVDQETHRSLLDNPGAEVTVNLEESKLVMNDGRSVSFPIDSFARYCLLNGIDQLGYLLKHTDAISEYEKTRAWPA